MRIWHLDFGTNFLDMTSAPLSSWAGCNVLTEIWLLLVNGIPINYLSRWLGHSSIQTTLIYLEIVPDPMFAMV